MKTKPLGFALILLISALTLHAAPKVGDTYDAVIAAKGRPTGTTEAGSIVMLNYPDVVVTLRDGKVTSLKSVGNVSTVPARKITDAERKAANASNAVVAVAEESAGWMTDADAAMARASGEGRRVFLFFTGSDWCGWCIRLNQEILSTPQFAGYAQEKLVLVELDFPRRKNQPDALREQNATLARKYGIRGYPTVIVLNSDGSVAGKLGYQPGGPQAFIAALDRM
jgi:protein disulfide-isomerase